jgi:hypothetical protein
VSKIEALCMCLNIESNDNPRYNVFRCNGPKCNCGKWVITYRSECNFHSEYELFTGSYKECRDKLKALYRARIKANEEKCNATT